MHIVLLALLIVPVVAAGLSVAPYRIARVATVVAGAASFVLAVCLVPTVAGHTIRFGFLRVDAISMVFLLATSFVYATVAVYAIGYLRDEQDEPHFDRYSRRFFLGFNVFAASMLWAPAVDGLALLWIAIEITTVVSALLVAIDRTDGATEASWKYVLIASAGLGIALLATIFLYYAGASVLGQSYDLSFSPLLAAAGRLPDTAVRLSFVLAVLGFGTKVGLVPVHTWLPDAHAEAPTPVSALLSGALLATSFYAVLRYFQVASAALGHTFPQMVLLVFGVASLLLASLYLLQQRNIKRMLAYSSIEHMGILAIAVSFGAPLALAGAMLHVLAHAAAKGNAFMGAGTLVQKFGTKQISGIRGGMNVLPFSAPAFLLVILALSALPPFGIFRSEFLIVAGGLRGGSHTMTALLVVLVTLAFLGLAVGVTRMVVSPSPSGAAVARGELNVWMVVPVAIGLVALAVLGIHPPGELSTLIDRAVAELTRVGR
ncbi:proton-conducting transporter transmembrane domain-containing protein [Actinocatenispora comari]|uniref:NADH dehydrogenase n=1 Tax=Actinocatenispora comari TaxID=2807577 RepID=A0A8J4A5U5_9ACTN|nr:proton-conducting transporter membrane subunit [Actinocatenispora comari]GIL25441.1 NADH dehydrogenase [Actinocatenispora comari]